MKRSRLKTKFVLLAISAIVFIWLFVHFYWLDGISGVFWELLIGETEYSEDYSEYKFRRVREGMTEAQVVKILGEPLFKNSKPKDNKVLWFYTYGKSLENQPRYVTDSCHSERIITFRNNVVVEKYHGFYFD